MKWATNKRLHFELGMIKATQTLSEVRITDVISVLTKGADHLSQTAPATPPPQEIPAPVAAPTLQPAATAKKPGDALSVLDAMIENAPEGDDEEEQIPVPPPVIQTEPATPETKAEEPAQEDTFHQDPLIQAALVKFEADFVKN